MIQFAVCDDEPFMQEDISQKIDRFMRKRGENFQISCYGSGIEILKSDRKFDILFLDIRINIPDGMETARQLRKSGYHGIIIFVTAFEEFVFDSFEVQACDYLIKPLDERRFERTMNRAVELLKQQAEKILWCKEEIPVRLSHLEASFIVKFWGVRYMFI